MPTFIVYIIITIFVCWIIKIIYAIIKSQLDTPERRGAQYEEKVAGLIEKYFKVPALKSVILGYVPLDMSKFSKEEMIRACMKETELDIVFVNKKGIFSVECKSRQDKDVVFRGSMNHPNWLAGREEMKNPFDQNYKHVLSLYEEIVDNGKRCVFSIVSLNRAFVFTQYGIDKSSSESPCINMLSEDPGRELVSETGNGKGIKLLYEHINELPDVLTDDEVKTYTEKLKKLQSTKKMREEHVVKLMIANGEVKF